MRVYRLVLIAVKIVSMKMSASSKAKYAAGVGKWTAAVSKARKTLGVEGFVPVKKTGRIGDKGYELYELRGEGKDKDHTMEKPFGGNLLGEAFFKNAFNLGTSGRQQCEVSMVYL